LVDKQEEGSGKERAGVRENQVRKVLEERARTDFLRISPRMTREEIAAVEGTDISEIAREIPVREVEGREGVYARDFALFRERAFSIFIAALDEVRTKTNRDMGEGILAEVEGLARKRSQERGGKGRSPSLPGRGGPIREEDLFIR
jgi:hypothetical protein